jgi:tetratricopeptide (TPR) repeat protein
VARDFGCVGLSRPETRRRTRRLLGEQGVKDDYEWDALTELMMSGTAEKRVARAKPIRFGAPSERYVLVLRMLARLGRERPVIMTLDDVQWGSDTLWFVQYLMQKQAVTPTPVLVLMTARTESLAERPLESFIASQITKDPNATTVDLPPLPEEERSELVSELLCLSGDLEAKVEARTAGNPLFATELVGDWVTRGVLKVGSFGFELVQGEEAVLPENVHAIWLARLERALRGFDGNALAAVEIAAVLGQDVDLEDWRGSCAEAGIELAFEVAYALISARLARPGDNVWTFAHGMLRDSLEAAAREGGRWARHNRACAAMLMHRYDQRQPGLAERLGRHLLEAGEEARALGALLRGVQERLSSSEYRYARELLELWTRAAEKLELDESDPQLGVGWLLQLELAKVEGRLDEALRLAKQTVRTAKAHGWDALLPRALRAHGEIAILQGDLAEATQSIGYARTLYEKGNKRRGIRDCLLGQGELALQRGDLARSTEIFHKALVLSQKLGDIAEVASCLQSLAGVLEQRAEISLASDMLGQALELHEKSGSRLGLAKCFEGLGRLAVRKGDPAQADRQYKKSLTIFEQLGARNRVVACHTGLADVALQQGRHVEAKAGYERALLLNEGSGGDGLIARINLGCVLLADGHFDEARASLELARDIASKEGRRALLACAHINLLPCDANAGDWLKWGLHFKRAAHLLDETGYVHPDIAFPLQLAGIVAAGKDRRRQAREAFELSARQWKALDRDDKAAEVQALTMSLGDND